MRQCKGICAYTFKTVYRQNNPIGFCLDVDRKYCAICECWLVSDNIICPCCHSKMRTIPKDNGSRNKIIHIRH